MTMPTLTMQRAHDEAMGGDDPTLPPKPRRRSFSAEYKMAILEGSLAGVERERDVALRDLADQSAALATARAELDRLRRLQTPQSDARVIPSAVGDPAPAGGNRAARRRAERARRRG